MLRLSTAAFAGTGARNDANASALVRPVAIGLVAQALWWAG
jgi:hypothetical protein